MSTIYLVTDKMDSVMCCEILVIETIRFGEEAVGDTILFKQDAASVHRRNHKLEWLDANEIYMLPWKG